MRRLAVLTDVLVCGAAVWGAGASPAQAPAPSAPGQPAAINPANFTGLVTPHATTDIRTLRYEFAGGARTNWHMHPLGQTLIVTKGSGLVQRWGGSREEIRVGDVVWIPPNTKHWHGASESSSMSHVAITEALDGKTVEWMESVSDQQYRAKRSNSTAPISRQTP